MPTFMRPLAVPVAAMALVVLASNIGVQHPLPVAALADALTWGALTYPIAFLITDLTNRRFGAATARRVVFAGFVIAVVLSIVFATPRIAAASGIAFLVAQLTDVAVFDRLRHAAWWRAPLVSSVLGSAIDTALFFTLAFAGVAEMSGPVPSLFGPIPLWVNLAVWDYAVKLAVAALALGPYAWALPMMARDPAGRPV